MTLISRKILTGIAMFMAIFSQSCQESSPPQNDRDTRVKKLLSEMSLEEKVGQMTQVTVDMILKNDSRIEIDSAKLRQVLVENNIGSIINVKERAYTMEEWHTLLTAVQDVALNETSSKIPVLYGIDAIHGANYVANSTVFPHNIGLGATRNPEIVKQTTIITAKETRASGIRWNFDPVLGVGRQPLWSRFEETYGEDPYIVAELGAAAIIGYEGNDLNNINTVASCMKHYLGYSAPYTGKDRTPAYIPEIQLRDIFVPPFAKAVESGTSTVMINSGEVNGVPAHASKFILTEILRNELGFEGLAVTDWEDIKRLHIRHNIAKNYKEAVKLAVNAGVDMSMVPYDFLFYDYLIELVNEGEVSMDRIDEAVARILKLKIRLGLFENPYPEEDALANFNRPEYKDVALQAALESMTLLKNEDRVLPLKPNAKVLIAGPAANNLPTLHGSWSYVWQGTDISRYPESTLTIKEAFEKKLGKSNVICRSAEEFNASVNYEISSNDVRNADYIVLCFGETSYAETPGGIDDLDLDKQQIGLAKQAAKYGKPMILVLTEGRPRVITEIEDLFSGILMAYRPASQGANAITQVLTGDYNPSGKLPFTYPRYSNDLVLYDRKGTENVRENTPNVYEGGGYAPLYEFGHGLSYTEFEYSNLKIDKSELVAGDTFAISVKIRNTGNRSGDHIVDCFIKDLYASVTPPEMRLKRFGRVSLDPGESKTLSFEMTTADLSMINAEYERVVEAGEFKVLIGELEETFTYQ